MVTKTKKMYMTKSQYDHLNAGYENFGLCIYSSKNIDKCVEIEIKYEDRPRTATITEEQFDKACGKFDFYAQFDKLKDELFGESK